MTNNPYIRAEYKINSRCLDKNLGFWIVDVTCIGNENKLINC